MSRRRHPAPEPARNAADAALATMSDKAESPR